MRTCIMGSMYKMWDGITFLLEQFYESSFLISLSSK